MQLLSSILTLLFFFVFQSPASAHSWVHCTNYVGDINFYNASSCGGYPRCGSHVATSLFGKDTGFEHQAQTCQCSYDEGEQDESADLQAVYVPGQRVCLAYPAKNHVATPSNVYIPDNGIRIRRTVVNSSTDDFVGAEYEHENGKHEDGVADYKGFQNCPQFHLNPDKALCTVCFTLEADLRSGEYSFSWEWQFNKDSFYTTCWEARVKS